MEDREEMLEKQRKWVESLSELETLKSNIRNIEQEISLRLDLSPEEIGQMLKMVGGLTTTRFSTNFSILANLPICRLRKGVCPNENVASIKPFTYFTPPEENKHNQRGTLKGTSAFFCATDLRTTCLELNCKLREVVYISFWKIEHQTRNNQDQVYFTPLLPATIPTANPWYHLVKQVTDYYIEISKFASKDKFAQIQCLLEFTADRFSQEVPPYPIASWLGDDILEKHHDAEYILYPSSKTNRYTCNLVFRRGFVDRYFVLDRVYKYEVESDDGVITVDSIPLKVGVNLHKIRDITWPQTLTWRDFNPETDLQYVRHQEKQNLIAIKGNR